MTMPQRWWMCICLAAFGLSGCATRGVIFNPSGTAAQIAQVTPVEAITASPDKHNDVTLVLAFSGGGTRAAALSYGVLTALRDTPIQRGTQTSRMLDEVDVITSVSGGSFTAAYYGLHGDRTFQEFEPRFLRRDIEAEITRRWFRPARWFSRESRTLVAMQLYDAQLFNHATFADLKRAGGPALIINASDLGSGVRFSYTNEYFRLLCSEIDPVPLAHAVTASSAVPLLFKPLVLQNYDTCASQPAPWLQTLDQRAANNPTLMQLVDGLRSYARKRQRPYIHLVDGGITDNLGLRALYDIVESNGGAKAYLQRLGKPVARRFVVVMVDAASASDPVMDLSPNPPSLLQSVLATTDAQINRYSVDTLQLFGMHARQWVAEWSTPERPVELYLLHLRFADLQDKRVAETLARIPTTLNLRGDQVDQLIGAGRTLLSQHPEYLRLQRDLREMP